jgi:hypothetical protein
MDNYNVQIPIDTYTSILTTARDGVCLKRTLLHRLKEYRGISHDELRLILSSFGLNEESEDV